MIIVKRKSFEEISRMVGDAESVLIVGCNGCTGIYQMGGEKQVEILKVILEMAKKLGENRDIKITTTSVLRQCDQQICATSIRPLMDGVDVMLSMACGVGVQTLANISGDAILIPAHDTFFIGMQERELGTFYEFCSACGECILFETGGVCPVTRCAKGMMNGPCGGCVEGKCEVPVKIWDEKGKVIETVDKDCAWFLIYNKLKEQGRIDLFTKYRPPRNRAISVPPRQL